MFLEVFHILQGTRKERMHFKLLLYLLRPSLLPWKDTTGEDAREAGDLRGLLSKEYPKVWYSGMDPCQLRPPLSGEEYIDLAEGSSDISLHSQPKKRIVFLDCCVIEQNAWKY